MRLSRSAWAGSIAATVVLLVGCSPSVPGAAQAGTTATMSSSTSTATTATAASTTRSTPTKSPSEANETDPSSTSDDVVSSETSVSGLDSDTESWFSAFCSRAADVAQFESPDITGQSLAEAQATIMEAYSNISISSSTSVGLLQSIPGPTVSGGGDLQANAIESFTAVSDVYGRGAQTIAALTPSGLSDLNSAVDAIEAEATASIPDTMANVDAAVVEAAKRLPECQSVLGG